MAQGSGSARRAAVLATAIIFLIVHCEIAQAATYVVGDKGGWTFNVVNWPNGKRFRAGDVLVFRYSPGVHNVVVVTPAGYSGCTAPRGSRVYRTGNDQITLTKGRNSFICNFVGHCQSGMKITVNAA